MIRGPAGQDHPRLYHSFAPSFVLPFVLFFLLPNSFGSNGGRREGCPH